MADDNPAPANAPRSRSRHGTGQQIARVLSAAVLILLLLAALAFVALRWLDSDGGRAVLARNLGLLRLENGISVTAERIDGSIFGKGSLYGVKFSDPKGVFATTPRLDFEWRPMAFLDNRLSLQRLEAREARLDRLPELIDTGKVLPSFDVMIDRLRIDRLTLAAPVAAGERVLSVGGSTDIRNGRVKLDLGVISLTAPGEQGSGDSLRLTLNAEPERNVFDMDAAIRAPKGGALTGLLGLGEPLELLLTGDGSWKAWQGRLDAALGGKRLAGLDIAAREGLFTARGAANPGLVLGETAAALAGPDLAIDGTARVVDRNADITLKLVGKAMTVDARGGIDFGEEALRNIIIDARLLDPKALNPRLGGRDMRATARLAGSFMAPLIDYRLTAAVLGFDAITAQDVRAAGIIRASGKPLVVPVSLAIARVTGLTDIATPLLTNIRVDGPLTFSNGIVASNGLQFRSDRVRGTATARVAFGATPDYRITTKASLPGFTLVGTGSGDVTADVTIVPGARGPRIGGRATVKATRLDNAAILDFTGGLPLISTDFDVSDDLSFEFRNGRLVAPALTLAASGSRSASGELRISASGTSSQWGPLTLAVAGPTTAPVIDIGLAKPGLGIGVAQVSARIAAAPGGWSFDARGASDYGPLAGKGLIRTETRPLVIDITSASIAGVAARGSVVQTAAGPFAGTLLMSGPGLDGNVALAAAGEVQRADIVVTARNAALALSEPVTIAAGTFRLALLLPAAGPDASGSFEVTGIERANLRIDKTSGTLRYADGRGTAKLIASGTAALPFALVADASFTPEVITVVASGKLDETALTLSGPAVFSKTDAGWALAPVSLVTSEGSAELSGLFGPRQALKARFDKVSLSLLAIAYPSLALEGRVSGTVDLAINEGGLPSGTAALRLNGLSRSNLTAASPPIDVGLNAELDAAGVTARAVIVRNGVVEGRAQAHIGPVPQGPESLTERIFASQVTAQARYNGPAQVLVGLTGINGIDVRGPVAITADVSGVLGDPRLAGTMRSEGARAELVALGTVFDQISLDSRFTASRLDLVRFSARAGRDGSIIGTGGVDLSFERSFPVDVRLELKNAQLVNRDDLAATASGNVRIATDEYGGVISGKLAIERATFRIGRTSVADVPVLPVIEINTKVLGRRVIAYAPPTRWLLNLDVRGDRRLFVQGMGVTSEWSADVRVRGAANTPEVTGRVQLVRGDYDFSGKRFTLTKGDLRFQGQFPPDPIIDVVAESSAQGFTAKLSVTGTAQRPEIKFSSVPVLPEDEVLSRILFGESVTNLSAPEAIQLAAALASLRPTSGKGFNPMGAVRKGLGIDRLRILPADQTTGRKTAVAAGQYIGRNVYVEIATDAQGFTATNIEVSLTRSLSILSQVATLGGASVNLKWRRDY